MSNTVFKRARAPSKIMLLFIVCTEFNDFKHCYLLFAHSSMIVSIIIYCLHSVQWF